MDDTKNICNLIEFITNYTDYNDIDELEEKLKIDPEWFEYYYSELYEDSDYNTPDADEDEQIEILIGYIIDNLSEGHDTVSSLCNELNVAESWLTDHAPESKTRHGYIFWKD